jgi:hypothetical protein
MTDTKPPVCRSRAELTAALRFACLDADLTVAQTEELLSACTAFFRMRAAGGLTREHLDFVQQQLLFTAARLNQYDMYHSLVMTFGEAMLTCGEPRCLGKTSHERAIDGLHAVGVYLAALVPALRREVARLKGYLPQPSSEEIAVINVTTAAPIAIQAYLVPHTAGTTEYHTVVGQRWRDRYGRTYTFDEMRAMGYFPEATTPRTPEVT